VGISACQESNKVGVSMIGPDLEAFSLAKSMPWCSVCDVSLRGTD
jgi:hypothetical protein